MARMSQEQREVIARNIRECRQKKFPGLGSGKKCVAAFSEFIGKNVSQQQWSPWERGVRTPDKIRLKRIAEFFGVSVEFLRKDHRKQIPEAPPPPGSAASFFLLANNLVNALVNDGIRIHLDEDSAELLLKLLKKNS